MRIEFDEDTFLDDDNVWSTLFVKINGGDWIMTAPRYGTEDKEKIIKIIRDERKIEIFKYVIFLILMFISMSIILTFIHSNHS
jgi:hypothetical protein